MTVDLGAIVDDMNAASETAWVVAIEAVVTTPSGKVAFVARHSDGRNLAMMAPVEVTTHEHMVKMAQTAFDSQHLGDVPQ